MRFTVVLIFAVALMLAFTGQVESKNFFKRIEKVGQNIRKAAEKTLPTVVGYAGVAQAVGR